jgi:hypothetical protein
MTEQMTQSESKHSFYWMKGQCVPRKGSKNTQLRKLTYNLIRQVWTRNTGHDDKGVIYIYIGIPNETGVSRKFLLKVLGRITTLRIEWWARGHTWCGRQWRHTVGCWSVCGIWENIPIANCGHILGKKGRNKLKVITKVECHQIFNLTN